MHQCSFKETHYNAKQVRTKVKKKKGKPKTKQKQTKDNALFYCLVVVVVRILVFFLCPFLSISLTATPDILILDFSKAKNNGNRCCQIRSFKIDTLNLGSRHICGHFLSAITAMHTI